MSSAQAPDGLASRAAEGAAAMQVGRFDDAATIYSALVVARPTDAGLLLNLGMARYMAGQAAEALTPLQKAVRLQPALAPASLFLGAALLDLGRPQEALPPLQRAVTAMPHNGDAREMLARALLGLSHYARAATHYRTLTSLQPANPKAWHGLLRSYEALGEEAFAALQQQAPESRLLELLIADVAVSQEKFASALAIYRRVLSATSPVGGLHQAIAALYDRAGQPAWAAQELRKAERRSPADCAMRTAECHFIAGRFRESLAAALASKTPVGRYWTVLAANRLATEAIVALEGLPPSVELHLVRAEIAQSSRRQPEAVAEVRAALALSPGNPSIEITLADALLQAHNLDEAVPLLERLGRQRPDAPLVLFMWGDALAQAQQLERAIPLLERAVKAPGASLMARASLGRAYVQAGRFEEAVPHLEAAAAEADDEATYYQLARAYQALERPAEAKKAMAEYQKRHQPAAPVPAGSAPDAVLTPPE